MAGRAAGRHAKSDTRCFTFALGESGKAQRWVSSGLGVAKSDVVAWCDNVQCGGKDKAGEGGEVDGIVDVGDAGRVRDRVSYCRKFVSIVNSV